MFESKEFKEFCLHFQRVLAHDTKVEAVKDNPEQFARWLALDCYKEAIMFGCVLVK